MYLFFKKINVFGHTDIHKRATLNFQKKTLRHVGIPETLQNTSKKPTVYRRDSECFRVCFLNKIHTGGLKKTPSKPVMFLQEYW